MVQNDSIPTWLLSQFVAENSLHARVGLIAFVFNLVCFACVMFANEQWPLAPPLTQAETWSQLPRALTGEGAALPSWARMLAREVPRSTAALLELDLAHRKNSPVAPQLRAAMRWVGANANRCEYAMQAAALDAKIAGVDEAKISALSQTNYAGWSATERLALAFASKMTLDSESVTDKEFEQLVAGFGERIAASMVLLMAYSNMQDRLLLCLEVTPEEDRNNGTLAPVTVSFGPEAYVVVNNHPPRTEETSLGLPIGKDSVEDDPKWETKSYEHLQSRLQSQRRKPTRLPILEWDRVAANLPEGLFSRPSDIVWYRIVFGYAPELAVPFERFMRTSGAETSAKYGRIFGTSLFWVTTRAVECPYCMGHCEMNWEVAGLTRENIADRSQALASNDWSSFPPSQQRAFAFARKLAQTPWAISKNDLDSLRKDFGSDRALIIALHTSRYHYMTRISNGFQLKLEDENVFFDYWNKKRNTSETSEVHKKSFVPTLADDEVWKKLPALASGIEQPLPSWVKAVAVQLPRTAAAMLELDAAHRMRSPLEPTLRAKLRWVIAHANHCSYSEAYALADLRRAGADETSIEQLTSEKSQKNAILSDAMEFARLLTIAAPQIPDSLFARLRSQYGDKGVAAMVLLAAYGNFQDRIVLGLNLSMEENGPLAPCDIKFIEGSLQLAPLVPSVSGEAKYLDSIQSVVPRDDAWMSVSYRQLQLQLEKQRHREPRMPVPSWDEVKSNLPLAMSANPTSIRWSLMNYGYAHELAIPWTVSTRTHWAECPSERILEESLFWVQTRAVECNYCMGHCEMLLEVAGLDRLAIAKRTQMLAETDWAAFPPAEQRAYAFARKLSRTPWEITNEDYRSLESDWGTKKAMGLFWWLCRGLYMTRISDGFQLPLERDNVFGGPLPKTIAIETIK